MLPSRYTAITSSVKAGGFGVVIPVKDTYLDRVVIYKVAKNKDDNDQLLNEIRLLSKARSRHIVEIYDVITNQKNEIEGLIIEFLTGKSYDNFHETTNFELEEYKKILYQLATALSDLHAVKITHRDLKLENFKQSSTGIVKLFDFGLSVDDSDYYTTNNRATLVYAAPELFEKDAKIDFPLDIYALGICAWMLAVPYKELPHVLLERPPQITNKAPSILSVLPKLDRNLVTLIDSCLDIAPKNRPSADLLKKTLYDYLIKNKHVGTIVQNASNVYFLSSTKPQATIKIKNLGTLEVKYDGLFFEVLNVSGNVYINNIMAQVGQHLHDACVLTFGAPADTWHRVFFTFYCSRPEVIL
ncbi:protein kinase domain-containing protein [Yersinia enterocolitica]|uniref:protein kinase domain-containing protein n=1 Tax=Yersinia enterocolitica TaxID=630 RepID=UPI003D088A2C